MTHATPFLKAGIERITELCRMCQANQDFKISLSAALSDFMRIFIAILYLRFYGKSPLIHVFFGGALESDMRGCCEECWALQLLPGKLTA